MEVSMIKLNYLYIEFPKKVRLISSRMGMNYYFEPSSCTFYFDPYQEAVLGYSKGMGMNGLFSLADTGVFDHIFVYLDKDNFAYYYDDNQTKHDIIGWINLMQFEKGDNC